jgi:hypothetical protein
MITLPADFGTSLMANASTVFTDVSPLLLVVLGIPFGIYVIKQIVGLIPKTRGR